MAPGKASARASGFALPNSPRVKWSSDDERLALFSTAAPIIPWPKFSNTVFDPQPGEHVAIFGATGQGKTTLMNAVLPRYPFVAVLATKGMDSTMDALIEEGGYMRMSKWRQLSARDVPRRVIWPPTGKIKDMQRIQREVFEDAFEHIFAEGGRPKNKPVGWAISIDEIWWLTNMLGMGMYIKTTLLQGRSYGISLIGATQRPAWVPVELYSAPTHLFFFQDMEESNLSRISDINYGNKLLVKELVSNLKTHQVLYVNTRTRQMARTRVPVALAA